LLTIYTEQYGILREEAHRLGIFVYEIRYLSKAYKIFIMEQFDFEFENPQSTMYFEDFLFTLPS